MQQTEHQVTLKQQIKNRRTGKKQDKSLLPTPEDIAAHDFGLTHPRLTNAFQGIAWMQAYPNCPRYHGATRTRLREIVYEMTGFYLPPGDKVALPMDTPKDIYRWLYVNALDYLDTNVYYSSGS